MKEKRIIAFAILILLAFAPLILAQTTNTGTNPLDIAQQQAQQNLAAAQQQIQTSAYGNPITITGQQSQDFS